MHELKCNWWWVCGSLAALYQVKYKVYMIPVHLLFNVISGETRLCRDACVVWRVKLSTGFIIWRAEDGNNYLYCESKFFTGWCCLSGHITLVLLSLFSVKPVHASAFEITCELKGLFYTAWLWPRLPLQRHFNLKRYLYRLNKINISDCIYFLGLARGHIKDVVGGKKKKKTHLWSVDEKLCLRHKA